MNDKQFAQVRQDAIAAVGDPKALSVDEQHQAITAMVFQAVETYRLAGFDVRAIAPAAATAVIAFTAHFSGAERREVADSLRRAAEEIESTGVQPTH